MVSLFQNFSWVKFFYLDHPGSMILRYYHIASTIIQAMDVGNARPLAGWWRGTGADGQWKRTGPSAPGEPIGFLFRVFLPFLKVGFRISKPKFLMGICEITDVTHEHRCRRQISFIAFKCIFLYQRTLCSHSNWQRPVAHSPRVSESYTPPVEPDNWNWLNHIFFPYKQPHLHHIGASAPSPMRGFLSQVFVTHSASLANKAGEQDHPWGWGAHRAQQRMRMARCWSTSPTSKPKQLRRLGYRPNYWNRRGRAGKSWSCQSVPCVVCPVRGLTWDYPKPSNTQKWCFFNGNGWYFSGIGYILKPNPYQTHIFGKGFDDLFFQPARAQSNCHPGGGGCPIPWRGSRPSRCFSRSLTDHGGQGDIWSDFIWRFRWTVVVGNWRPPKSTKAADSHHFPHCLMMFDGNFTVKKQIISFRHVRKLHQVIMLVTSHPHVSPIFYQTMKPIDGLIRRSCLSFPRFRKFIIMVDGTSPHRGPLCGDVLGCPWVSQNEGLTVVEKNHPIFFWGMVRPFSEKPLWTTSTCNLFWKPQRIPTKNQGHNGVRRCHLSAFQAGCQNQGIQH